MKCPVCGDDVRDGKCTFCGYVQTEYDRDARKKYEAQKRALSGGGNTDSGRKPGLRNPAKKPSVEKSVETVEKPKPAAKPRSGAGTGPPGRPKTGTAPDRGSKPRKEPRRPGLLKRCLFRVLVIGWFLAYLLAVCGRIGQLRQEQDPAGERVSDPISESSTVSGTAPAREGGWIETEGG